MPLQGERQRTGRTSRWVVAGLFAIFGLLAGYHFMNRVRSEGDPQLLHELQNAPLSPAETKAATPGDWPQRRGPNRDGVSLETGLLTTWPADGPRVLWKAKSGAGYSSFAVADGRVYTLLQDGGDEAVICWEAEGGKEVWRYKYPCKYENNFGSGPRATPTVDGDRIYTVGAEGHFHCLKAATGEKLWLHNLLEEFQAGNLQWGVSFSPLVEGDRVFTNPGGSAGGSLAAFDKQTGELAWKALDDPAGYSSPIAVTAAGVRQIIFFTGSHVVGVAPQDGKVYWSYPWETSNRVNAATPIAAGDYVFVSSGYGRGCGLLKISANGPGTLQVQRVYENNQMCNHFSSSVLYKDHVYGFNESNLTCMDFRTGKVTWKERGFNKGSLLIADGHLIVLGENGKLAVAEATPDGYRETASFKVSGNKCWTVPALAGGRLYVRDEEQVLCLDVGNGANQ